MEKEEEKEIEGIVWGKNIKTAQEIKEEKSKRKTEMLNNLKKNWSNLKKAGKQVGEGFDKVSKEILWNPKQEEKNDNENDLYDALFGENEDLNFKLGL